MNVSQVIDALGGTTAVAKICGIRPPSVSEWKRKNRIPKAWDKYLRATRPEAFERVPTKRGS